MDRGKYPTVLSPRLGQKNTHRQRYSPGLSVVSPIGVPGIIRTSGALVAFSDRVLSVEGARAAVRAGSESPLILFADARAIARPRRRPRAIIFFISYLAYEVWPRFCF